MFNTNQVLVVEEVRKALGVSEREVEDDIAAFVYAKRFKMIRILGEEKVGGVRLRPRASRWSRGSRWTLVSRSKYE